jgi:GT2 family glycosyltransferase
MNSDSSSPLLSVVIVSYNTREMTLDCLRALFDGLQGLEAEVWVVDNASKDNSVEAIRAAFPSVQIIENPRNAGFGAANNLALARARGKYLLLLNSDAFPKPGALPALARYLEEHPEVGVVGPRLLNADGSLQVSCWKFPSPLRAWFEALGLAAAFPDHPIFGDYFRWAHDSERRVDFVIGACLALRREVYEQVGGFDEDFFLYSEETDWQKRIAGAGWPIVFLPSAEVTHLGGASGTEKPGLNRHFYEGLDRYTAKHFGPRGLVSMRAAIAANCGLRMLFLLLKMLARPKQRGLERAKLLSSQRLLVRQLTHWKPVR